MIEKKVNQYGQEQVINNYDRIIKIEDKFLQIRLIRTRRWNQRDWKNPFTEAMPRAKFINPVDNEHISYIVKREDLIKLKEDVRREQGE